LQTCCDVSTIFFVMMYQHGWCRRDDFSHFTPHVYVSFHSHYPAFSHMTSSPYSPSDGLKANNLTHSDSYAGCSLTILSNYVQILLPFLLAYYYIILFFYRSRSYSLIHSLLLTHNLKFFFSHSTTSFIHEFLCIVRVV
jgi:hypothetical protein